MLLAFARWSCALAVAALLGTASAAHAQSVGSDMRTAGRDAWHIISGPAHASSRDVTTAAALAAGAAALVIIADQPVQDWIRTNPLITKALKPFGVGSPVNLVGRTWFFLLPLSLSLYGAGHAFDDPELRAAGMGCLTANLTTTFTRTAATLLLGRARPQERLGPFQFEVFAFGPWEQRSFPGGHASNVMSCASFFNHRFDLGVAELPIWALASSVGLARIADEAHWLSDTFVGMAYGYGVGRDMARRSLDRRAARQNSPTGMGLGLAFRVTF